MFQAAHANSAATFCTRHRTKLYLPKANERVYTDLSGSYTPCERIRARTNRDYVSTERR